MSEESIGLHGRCLCGSVGISAPQASKSITACHCNMCRRWTGGALLIIDCGKDIALHGKEHVAFHQTSAMGERAFCSNCGSSLYYHYFDNDKYFVAAGLFNFDGFNLDKQIFIDEKPSYYTFANETDDMTEKEFCNLRYGTDTLDTLDSYSS